MCGQTKDDFATMHAVTELRRRELLETAGLERCAEAIPASFPEKDHWVMRALALLALAFWFRVRIDQAGFSSRPAKMAGRGKAASPSSGETTTSSPETVCRVCRASRSRVRSSTRRFSGSTIQYSRTPARP